MFIKITDAEVEKEIFINTASIVRINIYPNDVGNHVVYLQNGTVQVNNHDFNKILEVIRTETERKISTF